MGIFNETAVFTRYHATLQFRDKLLGGTPKDPAVIEAWLRSKAGITEQEEIRRATLRTLIEMGVDIKQDATFDEVSAAAKRLAEQQAVGFKRNGHGLLVEGRQVKAMIKEATNILFASDRWGPTRKGPKSFVAERVFPAEDFIPINKDEPDGVEQIIGHVSGPGGERSILAYYEFVLRPHVEFDLLVAKDAVEQQHWPEIWVLAQENGFGAARSQGFGRFDIEQWEVVKEAAVK